MGAILQIINIARNLCAGQPEKDGAVLKVLSSLSQRQTEQKFRPIRTRCFKKKKEQNYGIRALFFAHPKAALIVLTILCNLSSQEHKYTNQ